MPSLQPCFKFVKKGLDKAFVLCCNSSQFEPLVEGFFKETRRMKVISAHQSLKPTVSSHNYKQEDKQTKKEDVYV